jgi:putative DNA methylase
MHSSYRKQLIEVALPLDAINKESAREKSTRHGHRIYAEGAEFF